MPNLPHLPKPPENEQEWAHALINLARFLRTPNGCPWDQQQSAKDFAKYHIEESNEYLDALNNSHPDHIQEECGDALFTLLASIAAAEAEGLFTFNDMLQAAHEKMIRRHDHVFGKNRATTPEEAIQAWNRAKAAEKDIDGGH